MLGRRVLQAALAVTLFIAACSGGQSTSLSGGSGGAGAGVGGAASTARASSTSASSSTGTASAGGATSNGGATSTGGTASTGGAAPDGGPMDAGEAGAPVNVSVPAIPCTDSLTDVYVTPTGLPPMSPATRGDIVRCALDTPLTLAQVVSEVAAKGITTTMKTAVNILRIEYRTERGDGSAGASSARVYLPVTPAPTPLPVITVGHPTDGIAASCTPSQDPTSNEDLALPWAGLGYAVIVSDYAGLGTEGVQGYLDNHDQAYSLLDAARALRKLLPPGAFTQQILASGWSQGGGAVLSAQALAPTYGADGTLAAVLAFAPEWPTRLNSFGYVDQLQNPTELTLQTGISENVVTVMRTYAYFYNDVSPATPGAGFPAANQSGIDGAVTTLCQTPLGGYLQVADPHVGDVFDPTLRTTLLACIGGADAGVDAGCADPGLSLYNFLQANFVTADPNGPPILFVQGLADIIMPPASEAACNIAKLQKDGVTPQVCVDPQAQHTNVVGRNMDFAIPWALAALAGQPLPTCSSAGMPACTP